MAGHSHWARIKRKKSVTDARRGRLWSKLSRAVIVAARAGGPDPGENLSLRYAIDKAKEANMPSYIAYNQTSLGVARAALGQVEQGFEHVRQAIKIHFETEQTPQCLLSLYYLILLCTQHPSQLGRLGLSKDLFYSIVNFVAQHPFNYRPIGDRARLLQAELTASIPPDSMVPESELPLDLIVMSVLGDTS